MSIDVTSFVLGNIMAKKKNMEAINDALDAINGEIIGVALYTVTFRDDNGAELGQVAVYELDDCPDPVFEALSKEPTKYYKYVFAGWSRTLGGAIDENALLSIREDLTLYAVYSEEKIYLASGDCTSEYTPNKHVKWGINPDYVLEIYGEGSTASYYNNSSEDELPPWNSYKSRIRSVVVGAGVTGIGRNCFEDCAALESVVFPSTLGYFAGGCFRNCTSLTSIVIPARVTYIGDFCFYGSSLTSAIFGNSEDWVCEKYSAESVDLAAEDLANPATAATYLTSTYADYIWKRGGF